LRLAGFLGQIFARHHHSLIDQGPDNGAALDECGDALGEFKIGRRET
jgi:hypothetical protein